MVDLREMCISLAQMHREWAEQNLKAWEEAQRAIEGIEEHPNRPRKTQQTQQAQQTQGGAP